MLDAIDPTDSAVWFAIYVLIGIATMSEGLVREWASADGTLGDVFDLNKAAPTLALGAVGGAIVFGLGGSVDPGLFEAVIAALIPLSDNLRSVARAVSSAVKDEREAGGDSMDQAIAGGRAARDEFDEEAWNESRRRVEEGLEDADGQTPAAATNTSRQIRDRFHDVSGITLPDPGTSPRTDDADPGPENADAGTGDDAPTPIGEAEDEAHYGSNDDAETDTEVETTTGNDDTPAPIGEAEDEALSEGRHGTYNH